MVPNVLKRAEERRSTLEGVSESRTGRGETEGSALRTGSPHRLAKVQCDTQKVLDNGDTRAGGVKGITMVACRQWR